MRKIVVIAALVAALVVPASVSAFPSKKGSCSISPATIAYGTSGSVSGSGFSKTYAVTIGLIDPAGNLLQEIFIQSDAAGAVSASFTETDPTVGELVTAHVWQARPELGAYCSYVVG